MDDSRDRTLGPGILQVISIQTGITVFLWNVQTNPSSGTSDMDKDLDNFEQVRTPMSTKA